MSGIPRPFLVFCAGLVVLILASVPLALFFGHAAPSIAQGLTALWVFGFIGYVVVVDSRKRWPGVPWWARLSRVLTFYRPPKD
jgi:hypothetical protein